MQTQDSLFEGDPGTPTASPQIADVGNRLALGALKLQSAGSSPAKKRFNQLLSQSENLTRNIEAARQLTDTYRAQFARCLPPLEKARDLCMRQMVLWVDDRLKQKGLTARHRQMASEILCGLAGSLAAGGDEVMQAIYEAHSPHSLDDEERAATAGLQHVMENVFGEAFGDDGTPFQNIDDLMRAAQERMHAQTAAQAERSAQRAAGRKKSASQLKKEALAATQAQDADGALRTLYRQLVSALHPDREPDPQEQIRKTALMKEANAAYERRDLLALLQLQLSADMADARQVATMAQEKLLALTTLMKDRVAVLRRELAAIEGQAMVMFEIPPYISFSEGALRRCLAERQQELQGHIAMMQHDLLEVQNDAAFKRWLKVQHKLSQDDFDPLGFF